ncbi:MAG TPA: CaiB/BaiF CoA-transferase family protein [Gaiellaceae bacterium]|nr:CaiB/BaiF CoA-transferase family protein [Gaiellaceae bacterium]
MRPLEGLSVVDLSRYLPGPFASRELLELGARVVRLLPPAGDPMELLAPAWHEVLNAGKETVQVDLKADPETGRALCAEADVVLESFRPGVADRLGVGPGDLPDSVVYCSFTGFGLGGRHEKRAGHDLNYQGWAGLLADTAPAMPPTQIADLAGGALTAVTRILAALLERERTGRGAHIVVSLTDSAHRLVSHRLGGEPIERLLTGGLACYRIYETSDGRHLTVGALEPAFFARLCQLLDLSHVVDRHFDPEAQEMLGDALAERIASRPLADWLELFDDEDVSVGPVATLEEAAAELR